MTVCMYRDIHTLQPYIIDFTERGCHTLRLRTKYTVAFNRIRAILALQSLLTNLIQKNPKRFF